MYIGGANSRGLRWMIDDIITEQLDAAGARPDRVRCTLGANGTLAVEVTGAVLVAIESADLEPDDCRYKQPGPERFISLAIASAFSERLDAEFVRDGTRWTRAFAAGLPLGPLQVTKAAEPPSLRVRFRPDPAFFPPGIDPCFLALCGRAREWAAFYPHVRFTIEDERDGQRRDFHYPDGLLSLAQEIEHQWAGIGSAHSSVWRCRASAEDGSIAEAVLIERAADGAVICSFVNGRRTPGGGSHVDGLRSGAAAAALPPGDNSEPSHPFRYRYEYEDEDPDPLAGLTVLLAVRLAEPQYGGGTKDRLEDDRARMLVSQMVQSLEKVR
jgi:DNA gyrase/topoisomerase IV subunit B